MVADTEMTQNHEIAMTNATTTIDPSVVQSRILQSTSLATAAQNGDDDEMMDESSSSGQQAHEQPVFAKLNPMQEQGGKVEYRRVRCPAHRYTPLRNDWEQILMPLVEYLKLQVRIYIYIISTKCIEKV